MVISIALPHIYLVTYETFSFPICNRSQYYFPSDYNICSHRFFKCNWLGCVTAGRKAVASVLSGAIYIQLCSLTLFLLLVLLCLPRKKKKQSSFAWEYWFLVFQHETQHHWLCEKMCRVAVYVLVTWKQGKKDFTLSTSFTRRLIFSSERSEGS